MGHIAYTSEEVPDAEVEVGDQAYHYTGLDPRRVAKVTEEEVWLDIGTLTSGPFQKSSYRFVRTRAVMS